MTLKFGTDGVRGDTRSDLTADFVEQLGFAAAEALGSHGFAIGRDTRVSGPELADALRRGVQRAGGSTVDLGVVPTPAVALWCDLEQVAGAMVSASHNPWHDNGVKLFAPGGLKLSDAVQNVLEQRLATAQPAVPDSRYGTDVAAVPQAEAMSPDCVHDQALERHVAAVRASIGGRDLTGLRVVADVANGAAHSCAPRLLAELGADVVAINAEPNGYNINDGCGSLYPEHLQETVVASGADAGLAFDGDADRVLACDHDGELIDGDQILAICAIDRADSGCLAGGAVVATVMANGGLRRAMSDHGIGVVETPVGDRHVLGALEQHGLTLGGEQSGHLIFRDLATTGDGLLTAVQLLDVVKRSGRSLRSLAAVVSRMPQVLVAVALPRAARRADLDEVISRVSADAAVRLGDSGRVLVRPSGTEPLVRVMVEALDRQTAQTEADHIAAQVAAAVR